MIVMQPMGDDINPDPDAHDFVVAVTKMADAFGVEHAVMLREMAEQVRKIAAFQALRRLHDVRGQ